MNQQKALLIRIFIATGFIYAGWAYIVNPAHEKLMNLKQDRINQRALISHAGSDFEARSDATDVAYHAVHAASNRVIGTLGSELDHQNARELIGASARAYGIGVNRIEPLREIEITGAKKKQRYTDEGNVSDVKQVRFMGEGVRMELDGSFANIAGFLEHLDQNAHTIKIENFRMVSSGNAGARMIAQFVRYELVESPIEFTDGADVITMTDQGED